MRQPAQNMGIATQLLQGANLVMFGSEITQEATRHGTIAADGVRTQRGSDRVDRPPEDIGQRVGRVDVEYASWLWWESRPDVLLYRTRVLLIDVKRCQLDVDQGGLNLRVTHELHERDRKSTRLNS